MVESKKKRHIPVRLLAFIGVSLLLVTAFSLINLRPDLSHLETSVASGAVQGNYHAVVDRLSTAAAADDGVLANIASSGTVDNINRLTAARDSCELEFALVQDGVPGPERHGLELIARLPKSESVFILGRDAATLSRFADMRGLSVGIGPKNSGTDHLARRIFGDPDFAPLAMQMINLEVDEQLNRLADNSLDLGIFVLDEDSEFIREAIGKRHLALASFAHLDIIARKFAFISHGRIGAGQYDPIAVLPPTDLRVLRVDTLVLGNGCASRTETIALLGLLQREFPTMLQHNRDHGGSGFFPTSDDARLYILNDGPDWADTHVPWLVDIMPLGNWFYVIMGISILFNIMNSGHKFRLWRIDVAREKALQVFREVLGNKLTAEEVYKLKPTPEQLTADNVARIDEAIAALNLLRERCRDQADSMLVPMGQEWAYRYQEEQMAAYLSSVRVFRKRLDEA